MFHVSSLLVEEDIQFKSFIYLSRADLGAECFLFCMLESNTKSMHVATAKLTFWRR